MKNISYYVSMFFYLQFGSQVFGSVLPENNLHLRANGKHSTITEEEFYKGIDQVSEFYRPVVESYGVTLVVTKNWDDEDVNAYADRDNDKNEWKVLVNGGLARDGAMTLDGLTFVMCHEFGHHLAGYPFFLRGNWAAAEGQADYFAGFVCLPELWKNELEINASFRSTTTGIAKEKCDLAWSTTERQNICYRIAHAALPIAQITSKIYGTKAPSFDRQDRSQVKSTILYHADGQCRLDTTINGANCLAIFDLGIIPGRMHEEGQESVKAEEIAAETSCLRASEYKNGFRSRCWFKPRLN